MDTAIRLSLALLALGGLVYLFVHGLRWRARAIVALRRAKRLEVERDVLRTLLLRAGLEVATSWEGEDDLRVRAAWIRQGYREGRA